ncbi:MAG: hypothetical protein ACP5HP_05870, partial [Thermogladius sp.]
LAPILILAFATAVYSSVNNYPTRQIFHVVNTTNYIFGYTLLTPMISFFMCITSELHEEETQRHEQQTPTKPPPDTREDSQHSEG